jgi:hypothetical protein
MNFSQCGKILGMMAAAVQNFVKIVGNTTTSFTATGRAFN